MKTFLIALALGAQAGVVRTPVKIAPAGQGQLNAAKVSLAPGGFKAGLLAAPGLDGHIPADGDNRLVMQAAAGLGDRPKDIPAADVPAAPDFASLDSRKRLLGPRPKGRIAGFMHDRQSKKTLAQRLTTEEEGFLESLTQIHDKLAQGETQSALDDIDRLFTNSGYYRRHEEYSGYHEQAMVYRDHVRVRLEQAHARARARGQSPALVEEARSAPFILGHEWRPTALQEQDSAHCAFHAFHNAVSASAGFAKNFDVPEMVRWAAAKLNRKALIPRPLSGGLRGVGAGVDVNGGLGTAHLEKLSALFGLALEKLGPPESPEQLRRRLSDGKEVLLSLKLFHRKYGGEALGHQVYLLGAYPSRTLGSWVYMVQDSGTGTTDLYTWNELRELVSEVQLIRPLSPLSAEGL